MKQPSGRIDLNTLTSDPKSFAFHVAIAFSLATVAVIFAFAPSIAYSGWATVTLGGVDAVPVNIRFAVATAQVAWFAVLTLMLLVSTRIPDKRRF